MGSPRDEELRRWGVHGVGISDGELRRLGVQDEEFRRWRVQEKGGSRDGEFTL